MPKMKVVRLQQELVEEIEKEVEKMLGEMKKVWNKELDCAYCRETFRLGDTFAICGDCYTLFLKERKFMQKNYGYTEPSDISIRQTKTRLRVLR